MHRYDLYGLHLRSAWPFPFPERAEGRLPEVTLDEAPASLFEAARSEAGIPLAGGAPVAFATLADQRTYVQWSGLLETVIASDGRRVVCRALSRAPREVLHVYLLGPALSFALIKLGIEPLHATVAVVNGGAVAIMGDSGYGKSSLGAAFLQGGHRLLTDDLLVLAGAGPGFRAYPGAPRIKLFPEMARRMFGPGVSGTPLSDLTPKLIIPLPADRVPTAAVPLRAIYVLARPRARPVSRARSAKVSIRRLSPRQACIELVRNTFNMAVTDRGRLERQLALTGAVAARVPVKRLSYPRVQALLAGARDAIVADLAR